MQSKMMRICFLLEMYPWNGAWESMEQGPRAAVKSPSWDVVTAQLDQLQQPALPLAHGWTRITGPVSCNQCHAVLAIPETGMTQVSRIPELCLASATSCKVSCVFSMRERKRKLSGPFYFACNDMAESQFQPAQCQSFLWESGQSCCGQRSQRGSSVTTEQSKRVH